jgi:hypothetical protein
MNLKETAEKGRAAHRNWSALARKLRVPRAQIIALRRKPDAPQEPDAAMWRVYLESLSADILRPADPDRPQTLDEAKLEKIIVSTELERIKVQRARGDLVPINEIHELHAHVMGAMVSTFRQRIENDLPLQSEGKTVPEIRKLARAAVDETLRALQRGLEDWDAQRERAQAAEAMADAPPATDAVQAAEGADE